MNCFLNRKSMFFLFFTITIGLKAEVLRWPQSCLKGELQIKNLKNKETRVWLQSFSPSLTSETELVLKPESTLHYTLTAKNNIEHFSILNFNDSGSVQVNFICPLKNYQAHSFDGGELTYRKTKLTQNEIWLQNLYTGTNSLLIEYQNKKFQTIGSETLTLNSMAFATVQLKTNLNWNYFKISATNRYASFNMTNTGSEGPILIQPQKSLVDLKASYFLVGPRTGIGDEFIIKITNPEMIQKAKSLIANPQSEKIVFAKIKKGADGFNRNWSKKDKSFWSWSTTEVTNFADIGSTSCNGMPQIVEDRLDLWQKDPGKICFWNYRLKKEIPAADVASGNSVQ